jgi:hypothetical protein
MCGWMIDENHNTERLTRRSVDESCERGDIIDAPRLHNSSEQAIEHSHLHLI